MSDLSTVVVKLMKGVVYQDQDPQLWSSLLSLQTQVRDYVRVIGLELLVDEAEGYGFLKSRDEEDQDADERSVPRLIPRRRLSFAVSLLLALLRKHMAEFDSQAGETRLVVTRSELQGMVKLFLKESTNEVRIADTIDATIAKVEDLGYLRKLKQERDGVEPRFEVMRILKAFVDAQWLSEFDSRLAEYARHRTTAQSSEEQSDNG